MAKTILDALASRNPALENLAKEGPNTIGDGWIHVENWRPWREFNYKNLSSIYGDVLSLAGDPPLLEPTCSYDREIWDEHSLDIFLSRFMLPVVNWALGHATQALGWGNRSIYLAPGSWTGSSDWGLVSKGQMPDGYHNLLPGDTKLSVKWRPEMEESRDRYTRHQWTLPMSQVNTYAVRSGCRHSFIITDLHLIVLRLSREPVAHGLASNRSPRHSTQLGHRRIASGSTDISSQLEAMSIVESFGAASYASSNPANREYQSPEYASIPWSAQGKKRLTVKMGLFCLCLMAAGGEAKIETAYPPLDSWRPESEGFRHNASGQHAYNLPADAIISTQEPESPGTGQTEEEHGAE
ncbi:uncharacterized protein Triagg1_4274 [Trichoderma aggressivum f. europaeum]|uniref:Uncharacterized protein n=1 Tax=Trichoderma aggressivum f. europaeum TaxID=173218 RepID=A0AAE1IE92_9HYPO|nr:hypothetical protein Triagg1_4274 [Trichoderma aggressivum f. europaeum]